MFELDYSVRKGARSFVMGARNICMIVFSVMPGARNACMGVLSFMSGAFSLNGRVKFFSVSYGRVTNWLKQISLIRHFVHETVVRVRRRIQRIHMKFRVYRKDI